MKLHKLILTNNDCYKAGKTIKVKGLMLHSTGANNPKLSRYIGPDDGILGHNKNGNHWNQPKPDGRSVCVHGFIGKDKEGVVRTYQTLPWNHRGWGGGGKSNDTHIHVEICEDGLTDTKYFNEVYNEAVELFAYLCKQYNLKPSDIIDHSEGFKRGIASNHGDVKHWFSKHGKTMDNFRKDVGDLLGVSGSIPQAVPTPSSQPQHWGRSINELAQEVIDGKHGTGEARKKALGDSYDVVQKRVNQLLGGGGTSGAKTISQLADEVIRGLHGSGRDRMRSLGSNYTAVQKEVNKRLRGK